MSRNLVPSTNRSGHSPFTAAMRVQIPQGSFHIALSSKGRIRDSCSRNAGSSPAGATSYKYRICVMAAQLALTQLEVVRIHHSVLIMAV